MLSDLPPSRKVGHPWHSRHPSHSAHHFLEFPHFLHHLLHLTKAVEKVVQFSHSDAAPFGDPLTSAGVENLGVTAFFKGHCTDHAFHPAEFFFAFGKVGVLQCFAASGEQVDDTFEGAQFFHLTQLF